MKGGFSANIKNDQRLLSILKGAISSAGIESHKFNAYKSAMMQSAQKKEEAAPSNAGKDQEQPKAPATSDAN